MNDEAAEPGRNAESPPDPVSGEPPFHAAGSPADSDFEILRLIGHGAYGEVYLARESRGGYRAVKVIFRESFDHDRPFEREYEGLRRFQVISRSYPDQVQVFHVGRRDEPKQFFYIMELADDQTTGQNINPDSYTPRTLRSELKNRGRLPAAECARIGVTLVRALENLHENGLIHRDIKPSNIIFIQNRPKLADIGLVTGSAVSVSHVGTEGFIPPEGPGSPQADIYSLGKVLYEAGTGRDRLDFPELPEDLQEMPDREVFLELNAVIAKACERDPRRRYASAREMCEDLIRVQRGQSVRRARSRQRARVLAGRISAVVGLVGLAVLGVSRLEIGFTHPQRATPESNRAVAEATDTREWLAVPEILARIKAPSLAPRDFPITNYGAVSGGQADASDAIRMAIEACGGAGGGRVVVPAGVFLTGPVHLRSGVGLHLQTGATLKFKTEPTAYLPQVLTRFEGMECYNFSPLIYALDQHDVAITGDGVLDGAATPDNWWGWSGRRSTSSQSAARTRLVKMVAENKPVAERRFGMRDFLRPPFIQVYRCRNVLIEGASLRDAPMTAISAVLSTNVIVRAVTVRSHGPQNDGCSPESSRDVLIEDCVFDNGDDCIAIKSGRNEDGRRLAAPSENIVIRCCTMKDGHAGVAIGSEISGGCRNVFIEDCTMESPNLDRVLRFKSNAIRGGAMENIFVRGVRVGRVTDAVLQVDFLYEEGAGGSHPPLVRNVVLENITVSQAPRVFNIVGFTGAEISGIRVANSSFKQVARSDIVKHAKDVTLVNCAVEGKK
jgi:polygalacturonase